MLRSLRGGNERKITKSLADRFWTDDAPLVRSSDRYGLNSVSDRLGTGNAHFSPYQLTCGIMLRLVATLFYTEPIMKKIDRRSVLRQAPALAGFLPQAVMAAETRPPNRKLRVVAVGGHFDDPQTCAGGTLALYADQVHDVVGLSLTGGPPPPKGANPEDRKIRNRLNFISARALARGRSPRAKQLNSASA